METSENVIETSDLFEYRIEFRINSNGVAQLLEKYLHLFEIVTPTFYLHANNVACFESQNFNEVKSELASVTDDYEISDVLMIKFVLDKTSLEYELILSPYEYLKSLPSNPRGMIEYWSNKAACKKGLIYIKHSKKQIVKFPEISMIRLDQIYNNVEFDKSLKISPDFFFMLSETITELDILTSYFRRASSIFSLKLLCSSFKQEGKASYAFEGYNRVVFDSPENEQLLKSSDILYTVFQWAFSDNKVPVKLGILRNIVSLTNNEKISECFNHKLLATLFSNYQIYLKENVKEYIDVKNKLSEFIFNLSDKAIEAYEKYETTSRTATLAVVTYFFTIVILRVLSKAPLEKIFNMEIAAITTIFVLAAVIHIFTISSDLKRKNKHLVARMDELRNRYDNIFSNEEKIELFQSESLNSLIQDNDNSKYHIKFIILLGLIWLTVTAFALGNAGAFIYIQSKINFFLS